MSDYVLSGQKWAQDTVTWYFNGDPGYGNEFAEAFAAWDAVISLDFLRVGSAAAADIVIDFTAIDGAFGTLAVANSQFTLPSNLYSGNNGINFDTGETWTWDPGAGSYVLSSGVTIFEVAVHEIGHSIGLNHPTNSAAVMYFDAGGSATGLTSFDIAGGQAIYGAEVANLPDLAISPIPTLSSNIVVAGGNVTLNYRATNLAAVAAGASTSGIYLTTNHIISTSDTLLTTDAVAALAGNGSSNESVTVSTFGLAPGVYWIGAVTDYNNTVAETDGSNNASEGVMLTILPTASDPGFTPNNDTVILPATGAAVDGLAGDDMIFGSSVAETIRGGLGNDTVVGGGGNDTLYGNSGSDKLYGQDGDDTLYAGDGAVDVSYGNDGNDTMYGEDGFDYMYGNAGIDTLYGGNDINVLDGGSGNDSLYGGSSTDWLYGGTGNDFLYGNGGPDLLIGGTGRDILNPGTGNDWMWGGDASGAGDGETDIFALGANWGGDVIWDFEDGIDRIDLRGTGATFDDLIIGEITGGFTWVAYGTDVIYLWGAGSTSVGEANISAADFIF